MGSSVPLDEFSDGLPLCRSAAQAGCYMSWNTMLEGGNAQLRVKDRGLTRIACVNPLSWKADLIGVDKSENHGSIPMIGALGLGALHENVVGARCGEIGMLWIKEPPTVFARTHCCGSTHFCPRRRVTSDREVQFGGAPIPGSATDRAGVRVRGVADLRA